MRLAHLADIHLGYRQYYRQTPAGINQREADVAAAFRLAVDGVIEARPDAVVVAGDLFHAVRPSNQAIIFCFHQFQRLRAALPEAPIVVISGNHDTPRATETGTILRLFAELGVDVVTDDAAWLSYPALDLAVLAAPHSALVAPDRLNLQNRGEARFNVLVTHGEVPDLFPLDRWWAEPGGAQLDPRELELGDWSYVALGHYHVMRRVRPRIWYAGALEYVSPNPWGELIEQEKTGVRGKGWLLVDLETGEPARQFIAPPRGIVDLKRIEAGGMGAAELDGQIADRLGSIKGGLADRLVRLVVQDVSRATVRDLNHSAIRAAKAAALHLHLDFRRPDVDRTVGVGAPGRKTLPEVLRDYLERRPLPERVRRERFVADGVALLESVSGDTEGAA